MFETIILIIYCYRVILYLIILLMLLPLRGVGKSLLFHAFRGKDRVPHETTRGREKSDTGYHAVASVRETFANEKRPPCRILQNAIVSINRINKHMMDQFHYPAQNHNKDGSTQTREDHCLFIKSSACRPRQAAAVEMMFVAARRSFNETIKHSVEKTFLRVLSYHRLKN